MVISAATRGAFVVVLGCVALGDKVVVAPTPVTFAVVGAVG
jgi:hypothetical protein